MKKDLSIINSNKQEVVLARSDKMAGGALSGTWMVGGIISSFIYYVT